MDPPTPSHEHPGGTGAQWEIWVHGSLPRLHAFVRAHMGGLVRTRERPSDIVQSALHEIVKHAGRVQFTNEQAFRAYFARVALNKLRARRRWHGAARRSPAGEVGGDDLPAVTSPGVAPSEHVSRAEDLERILALIGELDEEERALVTRVDLLEIPIAQVAREEGLPESTVRLRLGRARARLAARFGPLDGRRI